MQTSAKTPGKEDRQPNGYEKFLLSLNDIGVFPEIAY